MPCALMLLYAARVSAQYFAAVPPRPVQCDTVRKICGAGLYTALTFRANSEYAATHLQPCTFSTFVIHSPH